VASLSIGVGSGIVLLMIAVEDVLLPAHERTPRRVFRAGPARERIDAVARLRDALSRPPLAIVAAFSLKTNPRAELLAMARARGFFAETISPDELRWAAEAGFGPERLIYNGPHPLLERVGDEPLELVFADSLEAFARNREIGVARVHGVRLRPSMLDSRFGITVDDGAALHAAVAAVSADTPIGVSFHARREDFRGAGWRDVAADVLERAVALELRTGRRVVAFDVGGGWTPEEFDATFAADIGWLVARVVAALPSCTRLIVEPGQAVCTPAEALIATVLEVRERGPRRDVVVDAGYPDWPQMHSYAHGFFVRKDGRWEPLGSGPDRLLGRTCLEYDQVTGLRFPLGLRAGDRVLITGTGSYDHSMAFEFAHGGARSAAASE
jgi:diaminopimelate decarboxylase